MAKYKWSRVELGWWGAMWLMMLTRFVTSHQTFIIASRPCPSHVKYIFHSHAHPFSSLGRSHRRRTQQFFLLFGWWVYARSPKRKSDWWPKWKFSAHEAWTWKIHRRGMCVISITTPFCFSFFPRVKILHNKSTTLYVFIGLV